MMGTSRLFRVWNHAGHLKNLALILGLSFAADGVATAQEAAEGTRDAYLLVPGDIMDITVLEDRELNRSVLIRPDGRISLPIVGTVEAAGRTPEQLMEVVRDRLAGSFVEPPNVTVAVTTARNTDNLAGRSFYILGEVSRPGRYDYSSDEAYNVLQALTIAGGLGPFAARHRIQIRETVGADESLRLFNYDAVQDGSPFTDSDLAALADNAVIIVPERGLFD